MQRPLITVITAVRNGGSYLAETIASVQAQDIGDWEYIIVDDASTDDTAAIVRDAAERDSRVRLLQRNECGGPYAAANDALKSSRGRYIMRIDGDDLSPSNRFSRQLAFLSARPQYRACVSWWQAFGEDGLIAGSQVTVPQPGAFKWYLLLRGASIHSGACIERSALEEIGGYRELPLSQDYRLWCDLTRRNWLGVMPEVLSHVRFHAERSTNRRSGLQRQLALDIVREHWFALTGESCSPDELEALWALGYSLRFPLERSLAMLNRWENWWQADRTLEASDRQELSSLSEIRRWKLLRANWRRQPRRALIEALGWGCGQVAQWRPNESSFPAR
ncbi:MAG: glycosyl transferase [Bryobacterales bacterium]|nr:glycosyl transferase [Bryobacterales bacterium]